MKHSPFFLAVVFCGISVLAEEALEAPFAAMTPDRVRAFEVEVLEKVADLALIPPLLNTSPLPKYDYDQLDYGMTIGLDRTPKGRLWAAWVAGGDSPDAFLSSTRAMTTARLGRNPGS